MLGVKENEFGSSTNMLQLQGTVICDHGSWSHVNFKVQWQGGQLHPEHIICTTDRSHPNRLFKV